MELMHPGSPAFKAVYPPVLEGDEDKGPEDDFLGGSTTSPKQGCNSLWARGVDIGWADPDEWASF
jgi:hypothetical protein